MDRVEEGLVFASMATPGEGSETNGILLAESIRAFAGSLSGCPLRLYAPEGVEGLSERFKERLAALGGEILPLTMDEGLRGFPFMGHAFAAARAEEEAGSDFLAWLSPNTVVLGEPRGFLLGEGVSLGYRPVHHTLVGSRFHEPLDPFWSQIYRLCDVPGERVFPMETHVDGETLRPYFNSGILAVRPGKGLLGGWRSRYVEVHDDPALQVFYEKDGLYRIFVHQAVLSGVILSELETRETEELPPTYNYPLHLHSEDVNEDRPASMGELVTMRHEGFYSDPRWETRMPAEDSLKTWIREKLAA